MASDIDVASAIADAISPVLQAAVGVTFIIPEAVDANAWGPQIVPSILVLVYRPTQNVLKQRINEFKATVTVEPDSKITPGPVFTNESDAEYQTSSVPLTLTLTQTGLQTWTLGGTITAGNIVGVQAGNVGSGYLLTATDTLATVAANLAANCVADGIPVTASGVTFTVAALDIEATAGLGTTSTWMRAVSRRTQNFNIFVWAPNPYLRAYLTSLIMTVFGPAQAFVMPDSSIARMSDFLGSFDDNGESIESIFATIIRWTADFTVITSYTKEEVVETTTTLTPVAMTPSLLNAPLLASLL